ncbi:MAG: DAK2 domain-containing protein [Actinomycetota bacterium]|nr:DAK2 domain-containing protein [Actinomycetota bacterium]
MLESLDADAVRRWSHTALESLDAHRAEIDELNVFPVPDRDTGTNLSLTIRSAVDALAADGTLDAATALRVFARGAVLGARGNSGVIMSQFLRGVADAATDASDCDAVVLRAGLLLGADQARLAVADPVEGTILTVARAAADAAATGRTLHDVTRSAAEAAIEALLLTTQQLPELAQAGVVDAGGRGLVLLLDALARTVNGGWSAPPELSRTARASHQLRSARETGSGDYDFEVQYLLEADDKAVELLRRELGSLGDSAAVVGTGEGVWNVHVHVNDVGAAIESGVEAGRPYDITVVRFADQVAAAAGTAVVAVAPGEGLAHLFEAEGVWVVDGGTGRSPSTAEVLAAVRATGAGEVVLLPNASQVTGIAESAAEQARSAGIRATVVPTRSPVQGLAAVAVHDPARRFDDDVVAMAEAAAATRFAEVAIAQHEALTSIGVCQQGDVLGLIDGEVVEIGHGLVSVAFSLVDRLLGVGAELMTVLVGGGAPESVGKLLVEHVQERAPYTDVTVYPGGQPDYPLIIGVE